MKIPLKSHEDPMKSMLVLMGAGSRLGAEFRQAWEEMQLEGRQCAEWLGKQLDGGLAEPAVGAGQGSTSGGTRKVIVEQLDNLRGEVLLKALGQYPDRTARPVWTWRERDKLSAMWLLAGPGPDTRLSNMEFAEAAAALLCLPSPVCADKIGCRVGDRRVDLASCYYGGGRVEDEARQHQAFPYEVVPLGQPSLPV